MRSIFRLACILALAGSAAAVSAAEAAIVRDLPPGLHVPEQATPGPAFDVDRATAAWLDTLSPEQRSLSDAYFEGGYWLQLWRLVYGLGVVAALLFSGFSRRMRDLAERISQRPLIKVAIYGAFFLVASFVLGLPESVYSSFIREHQYGLSNLSLPGWFGEQLIGLAVTVVLGSIVISLLYAGIRRAGARWWVWATGGAFLFSLFLTMIEPVFIAPLFNDYKPLPDGPTRDALLSLARANEIPTQHLEWFDASKQTTRISANVSGMFGVTRISLNDNLLNKTSLPEIKAVLGHEMGHYVLNHLFKLTVYFSLLYGIAFAAVHIGLERALARWGPRLGLRGRADPAALPLLVGIFSIVWFLLTPLTNTVVRTTEAEADAFGLNAAREPQGFAMAAMRLSTYRKLSPGALEEFLFYDHPSGYDRVHGAMIWLKENTPAAAAADASR
ncbi:MAG TPA: M48 family metallopeptidase [Casimicrobiaceae bacterium]|jgi:STE24 endopeptidase|nr:M48 family metallopeptidase [Casimicrobiaceae bacterium]